MSVLYLLRHAHAEHEAPSGLDFDRKLSPRGHQQAATAAAWLARTESPPTNIISSSAQRTRQTTLAIAKVLQLDERLLNWEKGLYEASPGFLHEVIQKSLGKGALLLVGHNPGLEVILRSYVRRDERWPTLAMGTANIARLHWPPGSSVHNQAYLSAFFKPPH